MKTRTVIYLIACALIAIYAFYLHKSPASYELYKEGMVISHEMADKGERMLYFEDGTSIVAERVVGLENTLIFGAPFSEKIYNEQDESFYAYIYLKGNKQLLGPGMDELDSFLRSIFRFPSMFVIVLFFAISTLFYFKAKARSQY